MTTKEYLSQLERLDRQIQNKLSEITQLRAMATSVTITQKEVDVQTSGDKDRLGSAVAKIYDLEKETDDLVDELIRKRRKIIGQIDSLENVDMYHVLSERYVARKDWNTICTDMHYAFRSMMTLHGKALKEFERLYGNGYLEKESTK